MPLSAELESCVMHFGEMGSRWGFNRTVGQMFALIDKVKSSGLKPTREIVITGEPKGENTAAMLKLVQEHYLPDTVTVFKPGSSFLLV